MILQIDISFWDLFLNFQCSLVCYHNNSAQDITGIARHSQAKKDQLAPSAFRGIIGYANAFSRKYLDNEQQINANTKTAIKQSRDVKLSLQNYHCSTTLATTPVPATTITIMSTGGKYFEWLHINSITIQSIFLTLKKLNTK